MIKEIEIYKGKSIKVDFTKVERFICNTFMVFLFIIFILMPNFEKVLKLDFRNFLLIVVSFVTAIVLIATKILSGNFKIDKYCILMFLYSIFIVLSYIFSDYKSEALLGTGGRGEGVISLFSYIICFFITYNGFKYNSKIFNYVTCAVVVSAGYGAVQALLSDNYPSLCMYPYMGQSNYGNPNMFSSFLMLFLPIYIVKYCVSKDKWIISVITVLFAAIIGSKTFAGWLTSFFVIFILSSYFIIISKYKKQMVLKIIAIILDFFIVFVLFNLSNDFAYIGEIKENKQEVSLVIKDTEGTNQFGNDRGFIWIMSLKMISDNPWFGVGPDSFGKEVKANYMKRADYSLGKDYVDKAHSEYLQIAATTGIPSLVIYIAFLFTILISLLIKYIRYVKNGQVLEDKTMILVAVTGSIVAYMVQAAANISIFAVAPLFWSILGIGAKIASENE